tara:strand:+ start:1011 stop:1295 length:285 start_codon:yes stop_codon:yes gene_type:complete
MKYKFEDLKFEQRFTDGVQAWVKMDNGYEVSVIKNGLSYGGDKGLYEIGIYHGPGMVVPKGWDDSVKGWLTPELVEKEIELLQHSPLAFEKISA